MKLPPDLLAYHRKGGYAALCVIGTRELVARRLGDNMGGRPIKFGISELWDDRYTPMVDQWSPYHWHGLLWRVWTHGRPWAGKLEQIITDDLAPERLRNGGIDLGPDGSLKALIERAKRLADAHNVEIWDDNWHLALLRKRMSDAMRREVEA